MMQFRLALWQNERAPELLNRTKANDETKQEGPFEPEKVLLNIADRYIYLRRRRLARSHCSK
jgi:hypothetical protein